LNKIKSDFPDNNGIYNHSCIIYQDVVIVAGGKIDNGSIVDSNKVYISKDRGLNWTSYTAPWVADSKLKMELINDTIILVMGNSNQVWQSQDKGKSWIKVNDNYSNTSNIQYNSLITTDNNILIIGGNDGSETNKIFISNDNGYSFELFGNINTSRSGHISLVKNKEIIVIGGYNSGYLNSVEKIPILSFEQINETCNDINKFINIYSLNINSVNQYPQLEADKTLISNNDIKAEFDVNSLIGEGRFVVESSSSLDADNSPYYIINYQI
jgi:hypothetical protein